MHPLAKVANIVKGTGHYDAPNITDQFGNTIPGNSASVELDLILKPLKATAPNLVATLGSEIKVANTEVYFCTKGFKVSDLERLKDVISLADGRVLTLVDRTQFLLKPISKVFGVKALGIITGG